MALDEVTEEIRRRADLAEVVGQYVTLRPAGTGRFSACCPFHDEKTPSFYVSPDKGFYKCFGCGKAGDVFKFVQTIENIGFGEARRMLAERYGVALPDKRELSDEQRQEVSERERLWRIAAAAAEYFRSQFAGNAGLQARDYARQRGLSRATWERFGIGYAPDSWDGLRLHLTKKYGFPEAEVFNAGLLSERRPREEQAPVEEWEMAGPSAHQRQFYDRFRHRLMFPIWDEGGRVIAFGGRALDGGRHGNPDAKYLNSPETPIFHKSNVLFAWHIARPEIPRRESVIITEGYMDAIALHEAGFPQTVATLGTALTAQHVGLLRRLSPKFVYLCFDGDSAGMRAALRTAPLFAEHDLDVRVVRFPAKDDPDTYVRAHGAVGLENLLRQALPLARYRLETIFSEHDLSILAERSQAMRSMAEVLADVSSETEREGYIAWVTDHLATLDGNIGLRARQYVEAAVRRELSGEQKRVAKTQNQRPWQGRNQGGGAGGGNAGAPASGTGGPQARAGASGQWQGRGPRREWGGPSPELVEKMAAEAHEVAETLAAASRGVPMGVVKAEKLLLGVMVGFPAWRRYILERLPLDKWTSEVHGEIVCALKKYGEDAEIVPVEFAAQLDEEAANVVSEVMLADGAGELPDVAVLDDLIDRVRLYAARQAEQEILQLIQGKLERNEPVTPEERQKLTQALLASKRKTPLIPK